jgi:hypothetical protein
MAWNVTRFIPPGGHADAWSSDRRGPYEYGSTWYSFWHDQDCSYFGGVSCGAANAWTSTDEGATWTILQPIQGASDWPDIDYSTARNMSFDRIGDKVYMLWQQRTGVDGYDQARLRIATFDLTTENWDQTGLAIGPDTTPFVTQYSSAGISDMREKVAMVARGTKLYVFFCSELNAGNWLKFGYDVYDTEADSWAGVSTIRDDADRHNGVHDVLLCNNNIHIFGRSSEYKKITNLVSDQDALHHVTLDVNDVLQTYQTLTDDLHLDYSTSDGLCACGTGNGTTQIATVIISDSTEDFDNFQRVYVAAEALNPVWTESTLPDDPTYPYWKLWINDGWNEPSASVVFWDGSLRVIIVAVREDGPDFYTRLLWGTYTQASDSWVYEEIYTEEANFIIGGPLYRIFDGNLGIFFWSGTVSPSVLREHFTLLKSGQDNFAYFGIPLAVTQSGNYAFFV